MHTISKRIIFHATHLQPKLWITTIREPLLMLLTFGILGVMFLWAMPKYLTCIFGKLCP